MRVLEVGSGHAPDVRSHVLVDRYFASSEREGDLVHDRPLVIADGEALPFRAGSFSMAIAHQVLEHVEDPGGFLSELNRVASKVEIESPSPLLELLLRVRPFHRWVLMPSGNQVIGWPIGDLPKSPLQGEMFERLYRQNLIVYWLVRGNPRSFVTRYVGPAPTFRRGTPEELDVALETCAQGLTGSRLWQLNALWRAAFCFLRDRYRRRRRGRMSLRSVLLPTDRVGLAGVRRGCRR
jgi:SAM-dependent methyltransferase